MTDGDDVATGDETDETGGRNSPAEEGGSDGQAAESTSDDLSDSESGSESDSDSDPAPEPIGLVEARRRAIDLASEDLEYDVDGVVKVSGRDDGGWRVLIEVLEREAIPNTNDILGRYELLLSPAGRLEEYGLVERYRRDELREEL
jgi:hypothetical protein